MILKIEMVFLVLLICFFVLLNKVANYFGAAVPRALDLIIPTFGMVIFTAILGILVLVVRNKRPGRGTNILTGIAAASLLLGFFDLWFVREPGTFGAALDTGQDVAIVAFLWAGVAALLPRRTPQLPSTPVV